MTVLSLQQTYVAVYQSCLEYAFLFMDDLLTRIHIHVFPRPACKPHSVHAGRPAPMTISLGRELPHTSCSLPEAADLAIQVTSRHLPMGLPLLDLAPGGGYLAAGVTAHAGGLLHHLFTLTLSDPSPKSLGFGGSWEGAVCFCGPIRQVAPSRVLPGALLYGVRTFLDGSRPPRSSD